MDRRISEADRATVKCPDFIEEGSLNDYVSCEPYAFDLLNVERRQGKEWCKKFGARLMGYGPTAKSCILIRDLLFIYKNKTTEVNPLDIKYFEEIILAEDTRPPKPLNKNILDMATSEEPKNEPVALKNDDEMKKMFIAELNNKFEKMNRSKNTSIKIYALSVVSCAILSVWWNLKTVDTLNRQHEARIQLSDDVQDKKRGESQVKADKRHGAILKAIEDRNAQHNNELANKDKKLVETVKTHKEEVQKIKADAAKEFLEKQVENIPSTEEE